MSLLLSCLSWVHTLNLAPANHEEFMEVNGENSQFSASISLGNYGVERLYI